MQSPNISQMNSTQIISSPLQTTLPTSPQQINSSPTSGSLYQRPDNETQCKNICLERFKYVLAFSAAIQYLILIIFAIPLDLQYLNPIRWFTELFSILCSPLMLFTVIYGISSLNIMLKEKIYYGTRISRFIKGFSHEALMLFLNIFIGLFTSRLFVRYLADNYKTIMQEQEGKNVLNENHSYLLLAGVFMRCYFYFKCHDDENCLNLSFPMVHQSKLVQMRRETVSVIKSSFMRSLIPTAHFIVFYMFFGNTFGLFMSKIFMLGTSDSHSIWNSMTLFLNIRLLIYSWILSALILCNIELIKKVINIFATQPKQFMIAGSDEIILTKALEIKKFQITRHLAAQDLSILADSASDKRRKEFYQLSIPGGHPHNWKQLIQRVLAIIDEFNNDMKTNLEYVAKNRNNNTVDSNDVMKKFFDHKRIIRETNQVHGIRSFMTSPVKEQESIIEKRSVFLMKLKERLLSNRVIGYLFGEAECGKINFILSQNTQVVIWLVQGISAIVVRSIKEDTYGIVQHDIKSIIKSLLKLRATLEKVGALNAVVKSKNYIALRSTLRRSIYRIVIEFSQFFDDMLLDQEDLKALHNFITFKEL
ncbi:nucleoporin Ndc1-like [Chironomus tepperi]|uniref:nucleoporin Ndc1-like n=1 Tax=Chironomus tepperi TaxID=113505 RepID=UPI00391F7CD3